MDEITRSQGEETSLQEMVPGVEVVATPKWYELVDLEKSEKFIRANLKNEAMNVIATGYYLKHIKERGFFIEAGYKDFYDYAKAELGFSRSAASRYMSKNSRFSKDGNSPLVAEQYKDYSRSQLQEMLSLDDAELERVTPEMTVRQIRELRRQKETPVPYIELPGQMSIEDFPGIAEEDAGRAEESQPERIPEKQDFMLDVGDLLPEEDAAKAQQNPEIRCENGSEEEGELVATSQMQSEIPENVQKEPESEHEPTIDDIDLSVEAYNCLSRAGITKLSEIRDMSDSELARVRGLGARAFQQIRKLVGEFYSKDDSVVDAEFNEVPAAEYDSGILKDMIADAENTLGMMQEYWREHQPRSYTKHVMELQAYKDLLVRHENQEEEPEPVE